MILCTCHPSFRDPYPDLCHHCADEVEGLECPPCGDCFLAEDGITTETPGVLLCASCGAAETAAGRLVGSGVAA